MNPTFADTGNCIQYELSDGTKTFPGFRRLARQYSSNSLIFPDTSIISSRSPKQPVKVEVLPAPKAVRGILVATA